MAEVDPFVQAAIERVAENARQNGENARQIAANAIQLAQVIELEKAQIEKINGMHDEVRIVAWWQKAFIVFAGTVLAIVGIVVSLGAFK